MAWTYKAPNPEAMKQKAEAAGKGGWRGKGYLHADLCKLLITRDGQNKIRLVPPLEVAQLEWYGLDVGIHRNIGLNKDIYLCLRYMNLGDCAIDQLQTKELWDEDPDLAKTYYPEKRCLVWVMDLLAENPAKELLLWSVAQGTLADLHKIATDPETGKFIDLMDPRTGVAVFFNKAGKGIKTEYSGWVLGKTPVPIPDAIMNQRRPLADLLIIPEYEEVKGAMDFSGKALWKEEAAPPEAPPPKYTDSEPEQEAAPGCLLDGMSREELKAWKVQHKADIPELQFTIMTNWDADRLRQELLAALAKANRMDLVMAPPQGMAEAEEPEAEAPAAAALADDPVARKREEVRQRLAAAMAGKRK